MRVNVEIETEIEGLTYRLRVVGEYERGCEAITSGPPDRWAPAEDADLDVESVTVLSCIDASGAHVPAATFTSADLSDADYLSIFEEIEYGFEPSGEYESFEDTRYAGEILEDLYRD